MARYVMAYYILIHVSKYAYYSIWYYTILLYDYTMVHYLPR